ncbi:alpha/beta hydrolase [Kitasatospora kifunensis]|uniref:Acetyl esterase n=1 Tax=Kitasatospora kifunensis TaxID=58351 RepID=A0A7W7R994_KITKI|nr:alpha/beta hydrolase [Kitasatospora kifunensis]MBB4927802.1 acetyl esterase [Kitasatospora kifunensis]
MSIDPAIAAILDQANAFTAAPIRSTDPELLRAGEKQLAAATAATRIEVDSVADSTVPGPAGAIPVRIYRPAADGPVPTVVFFHGGGWITGDLDSHDLVTRRLCRDLGAVVVAVHYRRAPEHPFPAAYEDSLAATRHVADHIGRYGARRDRLALAGDSAGANLAAVIAQTFRDEGRPLAAQLLAYPPTDFDGDYPSRTENATGYMLTTENISDIQHLYAGDDPAVRSCARVSPLRAAGLSGLAPAIVGTAQYDPLRDEGLAYADALEKAGVDVFVRNYDGLIHGFLNMFPVSPAADTAVTELYAQLADRLS